MKKRKKSKPDVLQPLYKAVREQNIEDKEKRRTK